MADPVVNNSKTVWGNWQGGVEEIESKALPAEKYKLELEKLKKQILEIANDHSGYSKEERDNAKAVYDDALAVFNDYGSQVKAAQARLVAAEQIKKEAQLRFDQAANKKSVSVPADKARAEKATKAVEEIKTEIEVLTRHGASAKVKSEVTKALVDEMAKTWAVKIPFVDDTEPLRKPLIKDK